MKEIIAREFRPEELETGLNVRNKIFPPITVEDWQSTGPLTASMAFDGDEVVGFIPLAFREFKLAPDITITTAFENAVGTREDYRGRGVGTKMIEAAREFLKGRAQALCVYREDEFSKGYNFYAKTGHVDLHYVRHFIKDVSVGRVHDGVIVSHGRHEIEAVQDEFLDVFEETYYNYGGFPPRHLGYWSKALNMTIYKIWPAQFYLLRLIREGRLLAYIIAQSRKNTNSSGRKRLEVLEMASRGRDEHSIKILLESAGQLCKEEGLDEVDVFMGDFNPFINVLESLGFCQGPRYFQIMALNHDPKGLFDKAWKERFYLPGVEVQVQTPMRNLTLLESHGCEVRNVTLEMKEDTFMRWLMGRIDFRTRVREGTITVMNGNDSIIDDITKAIPLCDWEYHHIDFV